ncbi:MAG: stage II sporulation protein R [Lachnospiraceae bacterium]|nr:stage II sporulation protein R [Lachnospiraceae bacterium]
MCRNQSLKREPLPKLSIHHSSMRRLRVCLLALLSACLVLLFCADTWLQDARVAPLAKQVLRLHILADSDSEADQANKLLVRDAVLALFAENLPADADRETAEAWAVQHVSLICETAEAVLRAQDCEDSVSLTVSDSYFPTRIYGGLVFPCGTYRALRIVIGSGRGHNWWCVLSPGLCLDTCSTMIYEQDSSASGPDEDPDIRYRSWIVDFFTELMQSF